MEATIEKTKTKKPRMDGRVPILAKIMAENEREGLGMTKKEVLIKAGYSLETAQSPQRVMTSESLREHFAKNGLGEQQVQKVIKEAMEAKTVVVYKGTAKETDAPDHRIRVSAASLMGDFTGIKESKVTIQSLNVAVTPDDLASMLGVVPNG